MNGKKPEFRALAVSDEIDKAKKPRWTNIGVGFQNEKSITIKLDAYPVNDKIILVDFEIAEKEQPTIKPHVEHKEYKKWI